MSLIRVLSEVVMSKFFISVAWKPQAGEFFSHFLDFEQKFNWTLSKLNEHAMATNVIKVKKITAGIDPVLK